MTNKKDKDKQMQEKLQLILANLLKDDDNKYCVDCDAKGPRWASWSLGIFLCIRCAGIHRNLGVHISRVKSVNLDSWTPQQVAMMKEIGNSRGRAIYEANIEDTFRRPQIDSALDQFIRAKYEHKRYIAKEWVPPHPNDDIIAEEIRRLEQTQHKKRHPNVTMTTTPSNNQKNEKQTEIKKPEVSAGDMKYVSKATGSQQGDLLGLNLDTNNCSDDNNQFGDFIFATTPISTTSVSTTSSVATAATPTSTTESTGMSSAIDDLMGLNLGAQPSLPSHQTTSVAPIAASQFDKNSILALYTPQQQQQNINQWPDSSSSLSNNNKWPVNNAMSQNGALFGLQHNPFLSNSSQQQMNTFNMPSQQQQQQYQHQLQQQQQQQYQHQPPQQQTQPGLMQPLAPTSGIQSVHSSAQPYNPMMW